MGLVEEVATRGRERTLAVHGRNVQLLEGGAGRPLVYLHGAGTFWWLPIHDTLREYSATTLGEEVPPERLGWPVIVYVADTDEQARREFEPHFWYLAKKCLRMPREYMFPPGHTSVESLTRVTGTKRKFVTMLTSWDEVEEGMYAVVGSPATVREKMREALKLTGCGIVQGIFQVGSMPPEQAMRNMELFAREVMPSLREEFPGS